MSSRVRLKLPIIRSFHLISIVFHLKIGLQLLFASIGKNVYRNILELMPYIQGDVATTIAVTHLIVEYLETSDEIMLPSRVEVIILQNVLQWLHSEYTDIRWNATRILLTMSRNPENYGVVNHQLMTLIDSNSVYIKKFDHATFAYNERNHRWNKMIISFPSANMMPIFVVRMVCDEVKKMRKQRVEKKASRAV